jgi:hypothetical protein
VGLGRVAWAVVLMSMANRGERGGEGSHSHFSRSLYTSVYHSEICAGVNYQIGISAWCSKGGWPQWN